MGGFTTGRAQLESVRAWLSEAPSLAGVQGWQVDYTNEVPQLAALFAKGRETLRRRESVNGRVRLTERLRFAVYRSFVKPGGELDDGAAWALELQDWVRWQSAAGNIPSLGNRLPATASAHSGAYHSAPDAGVGLYAVVVDITFTQEYGG